MAEIRHVLSREILDSRGNPTVECDIILANDIVGRAAVPSGASTGRHEALEIRDGGSRFHGKGVLKAIANINSASKNIIGLDCLDQKGIDDILINLDGTKNKSSLGANAMLAVSLAAAHAASIASKQPLYKYLSHIAQNENPVLPMPFSNVINGGKHAGSGLKIQEFMVVPVGFASFREAVRAVSEIYHELKNILTKKFGKNATNVGDEGGFAPPLSSPAEALSLLESSVDAAGYARKVKFAIDSAATEFYNGKEYEIESGKFLAANELVDYYLELARAFPLVSIEDPFDEEAFETFAELKRSANNVQIVGDDLIVTNVERIRHAIKSNSCNCLLLKLNQIGTLTEAIEAARLSMSNGWKVMVSHRSSETEDTFISDLTVALGCGQIKTGAPARGERTAKYNRLLRIEEELTSNGEKCIYGSL